MARPSLNGKRVHVLLTQPQIAHLTKRARKAGLTMSDLIRRAVDAQIARDRRQESGG